MLDMCRIHVQYRVSRLPLRGATVRRHENGSAFELTIAIAGFVLGAVSYQLDLRVGEYGAVLLAAVAVGLLLARRWYR